MGYRMLFKHILTNLCIFLTSLTLAACSYNPLSDNNHLTGNVVGPVVGGAVGLGVTAAFGETSKPVLGLAMLGGAGIGYYVTSLRFASAGIYQAGGQVYSQGDYVTIEIPTDQLFEVNSSDLLPEATPALKSVANVLSRFCCQNLMISGNTSGFSGSKYERRLSEARAREVAAFLWNEGINNYQYANITLRKLTYVGYGNYYPVSSDLTNNGIRTNSRIQITAYPTKDQLLLDQKSRAFNNMGGLDTPHVPADSPPVTADNAFPVETVFPEQSTGRAVDLKAILAESMMPKPVISPNDPKHVDYYRELKDNNHIERA